MDIKDENISDNGSARLPAKFLNSKGGKPSGPAAPLAFSFLITEYILPGVKSIESRLQSSSILSS